jgi:DNA-binding response OmpR family regulator/tetratricopeptide (TPR) repeat protein
LAVGNPGEVLLLSFRGPMPGYVLIVERDADLQQRIGAALREAGYELASETDLQWARRSVAVRRPDAVVLDTQLGDEDGFRLAEELRRSEETRDVPVVFLATTAHRGAAHAAEARRRFAPAVYVAGRIDVPALLPPLAALLAGGPVAAAAPPRPSEPAPDDPAQQREGHEVEHSAHTMAADPGEATVTGTLKRTPFAQVLQRLYVTRATGSLLLARDPTKKIVDLADGYPVSVRSNVLAECLGQHLLERKLITREALSASVARMHKEKRQQGQILVEMGVLSPYNLRRALIDQLEAKLLEVFAWPDGKFLFKPGAAPAAQAAARLERSPAALILEGIRRHYDPARQAAVLDRYAGRFIVLAADPMLRLQEITDEPAELAFIGALDGTRLLESILEEAPIPQAKARLLLVALAESGMIQPHETTSKTAAAPPPTPTPAPRTGSGPLAPLGSGELTMMLQMARTQDHFWALGVDRDASTVEIDRAYEALARSFHADRYHLSPEEDRRMAREMFERLSEAHRVLHDPASRRAYVASLAAAEPEPPVAPAAGSVSRVTPAPENAQTAAWALYQAGLDHLRARRHHEAVEALRQAARVVPNQADYRAALGWALFRQAPADARAARAAIAELRRATQIDERHRAAAQHLAEIYAQTGRPDAAIAELERLLAVDPAATELAAELRRLRGD